MKVGDYVRVNSPLVKSTAWHHCIGVVVNTWDDLKVDSVSIKVLKVTNEVTNKTRYALHRGTVGAFYEGDLELLSEKEALVLVL